MKIGNLEFKKGLFLAPMAGVTDFAFRALAREFGADFSYTEMVSAKGLVYNHMKKSQKKNIKESDTNPSIKICDNTKAFSCKNESLINLKMANQNLANNFAEHNSGKFYKIYLDKNLNMERVKNNNSNPNKKQGFCEHLNIDLDKNKGLDKNLNNLNFEVFTDEYKKLLYVLPQEKPVAVQIFGSDPDFMVKAACLPEIQKFDIIDINMGCPAPKVVKNGDGSALLKNIKQAVKVASAVVGVTPKPVTVKMRLGFGLDDNVSVELGRMLQEVGVSAICLHGRTREQFYAGCANLEAIANFKAKISIPVIGNGDVFDLESYEKMKQTNVDAVMIGRGALGRPWIFNELLGGQKILTKQKSDVIKRHISFLKQVYPEKFIVNHMRKHLLWYVKEMPGANKLRLELCKIESVNQAFCLIDEIFV